MPAVGQDDAHATELPPDYEAFMAVVSAAQEDDDQGVYEVWWHANHRYPDLPLSTRLALSESVVRDLLREHRVRLVEGDSNGPTHEPQPVGDPEETLRHWATWVLSPDQPVVWMVDA
jgi:hypothetical protein